MGLTKPIAAKLRYARFAAMYKRGIFMPLIKFGKEEHLKAIQDGELRFSILKYYHEYENKDSASKNTIRDKFEGVEDFTPKSENTSFKFLHPAISSAPINITATQSFASFPTTNKYISCFSYFTKEDVINNAIFSDKVLETPEWDSVLLITDTMRFLKNIQESCKDLSLRYGKVLYKDFSLKN